MGNLKIEDLPNLEQLSDDELKQVVGGMGCPRGGGKRRGNDTNAQGTTGQNIIDDGGIELGLDDDLGVIIGG